MAEDRVLALIAGGQLDAFAGANQLLRSLVTHDADVVWDVWNGDLFGFSIGDFEAWLGRISHHSDDQQLFALQVLRRPDQLITPEGLSQALDKTGLTNDIVAGLDRLYGAIKDPAVADAIMTGVARDNAQAYLLFLRSLSQDNVNRLADQSILQPLSTAPKVVAFASRGELSPNILLAAERQVGVLDEATVGLLRQLQAAKIRIENFFSGTGPSLPAFAEEFAKLSEAERASALQGAAGRSPGQVLEQAAKARAEAIAKAEAEAKRLAEKAKAEAEAEAKRLAEKAKAEAEAEAKRLEAERQAKLAAFKAAKEAKEIARLEAEHKANVADAEKRGQLPPAGSPDRSWLDADSTGRRKELAYDPPQDKFRVREAKAAVAAEAAGEPVKLTPPVRRSVAPGKAETGVDFVDGAGTQWDHVRVTDPATANATIEAKAHPLRPGATGENALVDLLDFSPADARKIVNAWNAIPHPVGTGRVVFAMP